MLSIVKDENGDETLRIVENGKSRTLRGKTLAERRQALAEMNRFRAKFAPGGDSVVLELRRKRDRDEE